MNNKKDSNCSACRDLLDNFERFFCMLNSLRNSPDDNWLTVEDIAKELKISKSIVYRLIRNGQLEAVNLVDSGSRIAQKGHYRIKRKWLQRYLEQKKVKPLPQNSPRNYRPRHLPKVKNHLGL